MIDTFSSWFNSAILKLLLLTFKTFLKYWLILWYAPAFIQIHLQTKLHWRLFTIRPQPNFPASPYHSRSPSDLPDLDPPPHNAHIRIAHSHAQAHIPTYTQSLLPVNPLEPPSKYQSPSSFYESSLSAFIPWANFCLTFKTHVKCHFLCDNFSIMYK